MAIVDQAQPSISINKQAADIARNKALAQQLLKGGESAIDPYQMVSGRVVPVSPLAALAKAFQTGYGSYLGAQSANQEAELEDAKAKQIASLLSNKNQALDIGAATGQGLISPEQAISAKLAADTAQTIHAGKLDDLKANFELEQQKLAQQNQWHSDENQLNRQQRADLQAQQQEFQRQQAAFQAQLAAANRQPQSPVAIIDPETKQPMLVPPAQAYGKQPYNATTAAQQANASSFNPEAIEMAAQRYIADGTLPPLGMGQGGAAARAAVLNRAGEIAKQNGIAPQDLRTNQLAYKNDIASKGAAEKAYTTGPQGKNITALNTAIAHLDSVRGMYDALNNGDVQLFNKAANAYKMATGQEAPNNLKAAAPIIAGEIIKTIAANGGGVSDREEATRTLSDALSKGQAAGVIKTYQDLLHGKLKGLEQSYTGATQKHDFNDRFLTNETKSALSIGMPEQPRKVIRFDAQGNQIQ